MTQYIVINSYAPLDGCAYGPYTIDEAQAKRKALVETSKLPVHYFAIITVRKEAPLEVDENGWTIVKSLPYAKVLLAPGVPVKR